MNVEASVEAAPAILSNAQQYAEFVSGIILGLHLSQIACEDLRSQFMAEPTELAARDDPPYSLDYWRLNLSGTAA